MDSQNNAPPHPPSQHPTWRTRAIVSGTAAVAVMAVAYGIVNAANSNDPLDKAVAAPPTGAAAAARLRSQLPPNLKSAKECVETTPEAKALATITCVWANPHVPHTAKYSLLADKAAMLSSAESLRNGNARRGPRGGGGLGVEGTSCDSADDFNNGGKTTWQSGNQERGTMWCYLDNAGEPQLLTTDTATTIVTLAAVPDPQQAGQLLGWFRTEGQPTPSPIPSPTPTPTASSPSPSASVSPEPTSTAQPTETQTGGQTGEPGPTDGPQPTGHQPGPHPT